MSHTISQTYSRLAQRFGLIGLLFFLVKGIAVARGAVRLCLVRLRRAAASAMSTRFRLTMLARRVPRGRRPENNPTNVASLDPSRGLAAPAAPAGNS